MHKIKFQLELAILLPVFIEQFLTTDYIDNKSFTSMELEDLRDILKKIDDPSLAPIKEFLAIEPVKEQEKEVEEDEEKEEHASDDGEEEEDEEKNMYEMETPKKGLLDDVEEELEEVDDYYFNRYTAKELHYIFSQIIDNIDELSTIFKKHSGLDLTITIGFQLNKNKMTKKREKRKTYETSMVVEFVKTSEKFEPVDDSFLLTIKKPNVSDDIKANVYFIYNKKYEKKYVEFFEKIADVINMKDVN